MKTTGIQQAPAESGGLELPYLAVCAIGALFTAANPGTNGYPFLTQAAGNLKSIPTGSQVRVQVTLQFDPVRWIGGVKGLDGSEMSEASPRA